MKRAILVIDVQNEYFNGKLPVTYPEDSFVNILKIVDAANLHGIPVIIIRHGNKQSSASLFVENSKGWQIHDKLLQKRYLKIIDKSLPGSFTNTELEAVLKTLGIETVVICGYMTQMCCDTTARQAFHIGYNVEFLSDATGTLAVLNYAGQISAQALHEAILVTQAMRFSKVISTSEWIKEIALCPESK
jgi:nicotinamidase-related amidase